MSEEIQDKFDNQVQNASERILHGFGPRRMGATVLSWNSAENETTTRAIEARPYQIDAWNAIHDQRALGNDRALLYMATGLGKTNVVAGDIANFADTRRLDSKPAPRILFLAHQLPLLDQAQSRFQSLLPGMTTTVMANGSDPDNEAAITFATLQSMKNRKEAYNEDFFDYVVVDESHHAMADSFYQTISYFKPEFRLGVTATPFRTDEKDLSVLFGETAYTKDLVDAIAERLLVSPVYKIVSDQIVQTAIDTSFDSLKEMNAAIFHERRNEEIARIIQEAQLEIKDPRTILFTTSIAHAEEIARLLPDAETFHSGRNEEDQLKNLHAFRAGDLTTIVTVDKFNEGVDIPEANLAVFLRSTASRVIFEQQLGRVLRPHEGKDATYVLDFVGTAERLKMLYDLSKDVGERRVMPDTGAEETEDSGDKQSESDSLVIPRVFEPNFTDEQIDIINRLKSLMEYEDAPEGYLTIRGIARTLGVMDDMVGSFIDKLSIPAKKMRHNGAIRNLYSPDNVKRISEAIGEIGEVPEGYLNTNDLARMSNVSSTAMRLAIDKSGIYGKKYRRLGKISTFFSPDEIDLITEGRENLLIVSDEYLSTKRLASVLGVGPKLVASTAQDLSITGVVARVEGNKMSQGLQFSPEEQQLIAIKIREESAPDDYVSLGSLVSELKAHSDTVRSVLNNLDIKVRKGRGDNGQISDFISPEDGERIKGEFSLRRKAPEGYLSFNSIAPLIGVTPITVQRFTERTGIEGSDLYGVNGKLGKYFSPAQVQQIRESFSRKSRNS